jgi:hypothetical protein
MSAYLIVDVDDILEYLEAQTFSPNLLDVALSLRNTAALAAGLPSASDMRAIAVTDWNQYSRPDASGVNVQQVFLQAGYELFTVSERKFLTDALLTEFFPIDSEATVDELIFASSQSDFLGIISRLNLKPNVRIRVWADVRPSDDTVIFQPLESILGVKTKSVALYIDFENISISLNEQGYIVDLGVLIDAIKVRTSQYGQVVHMAAYAPWGQRGSLPPMLDIHGREISDDVPSRLAVESIDPVFSLPGKNSADLRIAKDVLAESAAPNSPEIVIIASGDRDFNDIYNTLRARGKQVVVWGVQGSTSRVLENNTSITLEYIDDFAPFRKHKELVGLFDQVDDDEYDHEDDFRPSQWSSVVLQYDFMHQAQPKQRITAERLAQQLTNVSATANDDRAYELIEQATNIGILAENEADGSLRLRHENPIVAQTHLIRDHILSRVRNTLSVRNWNYVNYGFLLKGIAMDDKLVGHGINPDDNWRSEWIDFLVRENILERELIPHRHNPDDLVPVIRVPDEVIGGDAASFSEPVNPDVIADMSVRIIVSVEQFTSFRKFIWCPLGSLHKRMRPFDEGTAFQQAVELLESQGAIDINEYPNPQSDFMTKGVSLNADADFVIEVLETRNGFIESLLKLYGERKPITYRAIQQETGHGDHMMELWISIMELENVLNPVPGQPDLYSLFRTHHTVSIVANDQPRENGMFEE